MMATLGTIGTVLGWIVMWAVCVFFVAPVADWALNWWKKTPEAWPFTTQTRPRRGLIGEAEEGRAASIRYSPKTSELFPRE